MGAESCLYPWKRLFLLSDHRINNIFLYSMERNNDCHVWRIMRRVLAVVLLLTSTPGWAQQPLQKSVVYNDDGTVTFFYQNNHAHEVMVDVQFAGRNKMTRDEKTGWWTVTVGPAAPDMYPYCFIVDGVSIMDPLCNQYFPNEGFKNSLLEIPGKNGPLAHDIKNVPHGTVNYINYFSKSLGATNHAVVYVPASFKDNPDRKYPVFYLISGTTDTEEVYYKVGRANYILDNLLAEGLAKEMIIVMPYGNPYKLLTKPVEMAAVPQTRFGGDVFSNDLINDLMPYVEQHFPTINDRDHRAIGGFSRGGNQGLSCGLHNLDKFSYLCSYSSFTSTDIPGVYDNSADTNSKIHLFWLGVGTDDFLYGNARDYMEFLDKKGIRSVKEFTNDKYGHTWMNAKYFLDKTLRLLFNPEASQAAMKNAQPTPAATGKEPQFTAGVMARMFPRPIISPEYSTSGIVFRMKAPDARQVMLETELLEQPVAMQKDGEGLWSVQLNDCAMTTFKYCFIVDGTRVADPNNMYLSPDKGFKYSIASSPFAPYSFASMKDIPHGIVSYDLNKQEAVYTSPSTAAGGPQLYVQLVPGKNDTMESWFKVGGADAIADQLLAEGKIKQCVLTTGNPLQLFRGRRPGNVKVKVVKADDYKTWQERREALEKALLPADYRLDVSNLSMIIDADGGARIRSFMHHGKEVISQLTWPETFGSTFWTSPQKEWSWPPVPEYDKMPYQVEQTDGRLVMTSQVSEKMQYRIRKEFVADELDNAIVVTYSIINEGKEARKVAPWEITRVPNDGIVFFDAPAKKIWPANLMSFKSANGLSWYTIDVAEENRKVNADGKGWLAYCNNGLLLVKRFQDLSPAQPAPDEAEIQVYVNRGKSYVELESQGAYTLLQPGESLQWTVRWYLVPCQLPAVPSKQLSKMVKQILSKKR